MPNGGSDNCGTCWFNARNKGKAGYGHARNPEPNFCSIRGFAIVTDPFWTYCGNHPHRRPERDRIPIGPVFVADDEGTRMVSHPSPDTEEVRLHLLGLLRGVEARPSEEYPIGVYLEEVLVWQLGEFRESRAVPDLERILAFPPEIASGHFGRTRASLVAAARQALSKIGDRSG
jgi:hypothetical protein